MSIVEGYMAYARRTPLIAGCRPEGLVNVPDLAVVLGKIIPSRLLGVYKDQEGVLGALGIGRLRVVVHASEREYLPQHPRGFTVFKGRIEDMARQACCDADAVYLNHVHPITGEIRDVKAIADELSSCSRNVLLVVDLSLSAGLLNAPKLDARHIYIYRTDKWLMGPPLVAVHGNHSLRAWSSEADPWDKKCLSASVAWVLENLLHSSGKHGLFKALSEISWEVDRLGLRSPTPPEESRRAAMISVHAGRSSIKVAGILASHGIIVDVSGQYLRISPHADINRSAMDALLGGLADAKPLMV